MCVLQLDFIKRQQCCGNEIRNIAENPMTAVTVSAEKKLPNAVPENSMIQKTIWQGQASNAKDAKNQPVKRLPGDRD